MIQALMENVVTNNQPNITMTVEIRIGISRSACPRRLSPHRRTALRIQSTAYLMLLYHIAQFTHWLVDIHPFTTDWPHWQLSTEKTMPNLFRNKIFHLLETNNDTTEVKQLIHSLGGKVRRTSFSYFVVICCRRQKISGLSSHFIDVTFDWHATEGGVNFYFPGICVFSKTLVAICFWRRTLSNATLQQISKKLNQRVHYVICHPNSSPERYDEAAETGKPIISPEWIVSYVFYWNSASLHYILTNNAVKQVS